MKPISSYVITRPTSAYTVISRVKKLVAEEPRRMWMRKWFITGTRERLASHCGVEKCALPACRTIGCMAGWGSFVVKLSFTHPRQIAKVLCGDSTAADELHEAFYEGTPFYLPDGTQEQADAVCTYLTGLQVRHEALLKSRIVYPGGEVKVKGVTRTPRAGSEPARAGSEPARITEPASRESRQ